MPRIEVWLYFESEDDRARFLETESAVRVPDLVEDERGLRFEFDSEDERAAMVHANVLYKAVCERAGIDADRIEPSHVPPERRSPPLPPG